MARPLPGWIPARFEPSVHAVVQRIRRSARARRLIAHVPVLGSWLLGGDDPHFHCAVDHTIPDTLNVGRGTCLLVSGYCFHDSRRLVRLELAVNGVRHRANAFGMPRAEVLTQYGAHADSADLPFYSGFWVIAPIPEVQQETPVHLALVATFAGGVRRTRTFSVIRAVPDASACSPLPLAAFNRDQPATVAICMATYNPPIDLFANQIRSIQEQSFADWICIISDDCSRPDLYNEVKRITAHDPRFYVTRSGVNRGYYHNFEHALTLVPEEVRYVAFADQDDVWYPEKLDTLLSRFEPGVTLVYSDMRIVNSGGHELAPTFWTERDNNFTDLTALVFDNCVTGAASLFRRDLLTYALPFPLRLGDAYHDHWVACVALAMGKIVFVDRPLHSYVQHGANVIGAAWSRAGARRTFAWQWRAMRAFLARCRTVTDPQARPTDITFDHWRALYFGEVLRRELLATTLLLRCTRQLSGRRRSALRRVSTMDSRRSSYLWVIGRCLRQQYRPDSRLGGEIEFIKGLLWKRRAPVVESFVQPLHERALHLTPRADQSEWHWITTLRTPLRLRVDTHTPPRVNILVQTIAWTYFFGGYITVCGLALRLAQRGMNVRIITLGATPRLLPADRHRIEAFQDLDGLFSHVNFAEAHDRARPIDVNPADRFIASSVWSAHVAHQAARELGRGSFVYLAQEFEPLFHPAGTLSALARQAYDLPHHAVFSSTLLRDYFREQRLGVFGRGEEHGDRHTLVLRNPITDVGPVAACVLRQRRSRRLLFYARPEEHAARNMFELGMMALNAAIECGTFDAVWEFFGIGALVSTTHVPLACGRSLQLIPRQDQDAYAAILREHDLGLSLMDTPHPSLVPIEMASAGMVVVTTTYANKSAESLRAISDNIIGVAPTMEDVVGGLIQAVARTADAERRAAGARVDWPRSAAEAFDDRFLERLRQFIEEA